MNAIGLLDNLIRNLNPHDFIHFFRQKNRSFRPFNEPHAQYNDEDFTDCLYIGEITFNANVVAIHELPLLIIYSFKVNRDLTERSGKKAQYEKGKNILRAKQADAGIFIFYDSSGRFRFSLIHTDYTGTRRQWSHFKRFTYFVSPEETNRTFLQRIGDGDFSSLEAIKEAFSVEKVTKEFYQEIANWYFWALKNVRFPIDAEAEPNGRNIALIRLITRLIFIWFMRQKGIIKKELFDKRFLEGILKDPIVSLSNRSPEGSTFYKAILQNLFFATLNTPIEQRKFRREERYKGYLNKDYMNHTYFRYHNLFKDPDRMKDLFNDIPFLNGGLFECLDKRKSGSPKNHQIFWGASDDESNDTGRELRIDGFSDDPKKQPHVPNYLFFSDEKEVDLNEDYGTKEKRYKARGIINILSSYNFTIDENTPVDEEVALDPELLGRVFENLLASYNPETATTARKATGSYYTPREIVDYMVRESLKEYFKQHLINLKNSPPDKGENPNGEGVKIFNSPDKGENPNGEGVKIFNKPEFKFFRRELRKNLTPAEAKLWTLLQGKKLEGRKFRRQHSVGNYILDFYCPEEKLSVELDGEGHFTASGAEYDAERDAFINLFGIKVLRFENKWVWDNPEGLLEEIKNNFGWSNQPPRPSDTPPCKGGELLEPLSPEDSSPCKGEQLLEQRLRKLFSYDDEPHDFSEAETKAIIQAIYNLKLLDPAVGSGAFPMGALHTLVHILHKLDPHNEKWKAEQLKAVAHITDPKIRQDTIQRIEESFELNELDYGRKLYLIQNCIYGVDIQPIAIQIAKLRFFISLLVDEKVDRTKPNLGIEPLPNLETKFMAANTLIGLQRPEQLTFKSPDVQRLENELVEIRKEYFIATTSKEKERLKKRDSNVRNALAESLKKSGFQSDATEKIARWNPYDTNKSSDWFDHEWMFGITEGFDVVIGNPPYGVKLEDIEKLTNTYKFYDRQKNSAAFFIESGTKLTNSKGVVSFIIPKSLSFSEGWKKTRQLVTHNNKLLSVIDVSKAFENVLLEQIIVCFSKVTTKTDYQFSVGDGWNDKIKIRGNGTQTLIDQLDILPIYVDDRKQKILNKLHQGSILLSKISKTFRGLPLQSKVSKSGQPILRGKNIGKYKIYGNIDKINLHVEILSSAKVREILKPKIISQNIVAHVMNPYDRIIVIATFDEKGLLTLDTVMNTYLTTDEFAYQYVLAILNSQFASWFYYWFVYNRAIRTMHFDSYYIGKIPIKKIELEDQQPFITLVDQILNAKKQDPNTDTSALEREIDEMVYKLYGLTEDEIKIIENIK